MPLDFDNISSDFLKKNPKALGSMLNKLLAEESPKRVRRKMLAEFDIGPKFIARKTGIDLRSIGVKSTLKKSKQKTIAARPPQRQPAPRAVRAPAEKPLPPLKILREKYSAFAKHYEMYEAASKAFMTLGHIFNAREFRNTGGNTTSNFNKFDRATGEEMKSVIGNVAKAENGKYMRVTPNYVETIVDLNLGGNDIQLAFGINDGSSDFVDRERQAALKIVKAYFPNFELPSEWESIEEEIQGFNGIPRKVRTARLSGADQKVMYSLEQLARIKPPYTHSTDQTSKDSKWKGETHVAVPADFAKKGFSNICYLELILKPSEGAFTTSYEAKNSGQDSGPLKNCNISIPIEARIIMRWPMEFVLFATSSSSRQDLIPFLFFHYISWHRAAYGGGRTQGGGFSIKAPHRVNHLGVITNLMAEEQANGRKIKPRTNADGFVIMGSGQPANSGQVFWIPEKTNRVAEYVSTIRNTYDPPSNQFDFSTQVTGGLRGVGLLTDWVNEKYSYVREDGIGLDSSDIAGIETYDLIGSVPLDVVTVNRDLQTPLRSDEDNVRNFASMLRKFMRGEFKHAPTKQYESPEYRAQIEGINPGAHYMDSPEKMLDFLLGSGALITWANLGGEDIKDDGENSNRVTSGIVDMQGQPFQVKAAPRRYDIERGICRIFREAAEEMFANWEKLRLPHYMVIQHRYRFALVAKYGKNATEYAAAVARKIRRNKAEGIDLKNPNSVLMVNLPGIPTFMPHQVECANALSTVPDSSMVDVTMGGGKTLIGIIDVLRLIYNKNIKRGLVIVPNNLVRDWIEKVTDYSNGTVNAFAITNTTVRRMQKIAKNDKSNRPNYDMLTEIINGAPPNTIFITDFSFVAGSKTSNEQIIYGNKDITRQYNAEFLRDIGFEGVFIDESHFAKNIGTSSAEGSLRTQGVAIISTAAKLLRELSGTMVSNTLTDLVGQAALFNPAMFGNKDTFQAKYAKKVPGRDTLQYLPESYENIGKDMAPYTQRLTYKRQSWAFLLPNMIEEFWPVQMTENQQKFYDKQVEDKLNELAASDPKLARKLVDGNEDDQEGILAGLKTHFAKIEEFVYAPDSNEVFASQNGLITEGPNNDLVTPKMGMLVRLLDKHFAGYTDEETNVVYPPSPHKVIVFSHRKETSRHFMRWLPERFKKMARHYTAGDHQAIEAFKGNDRIKILIADELSINTGQDFQVASRLIRTETLWTPGEQDQGVARVWRPDFKNLAGRPQVWMDWIFTDYTLEVPKIGRLVSKIVDKIKYDRLYDPAFTKENFPIKSPGFRAKLKSIGIHNLDAPVNDMLPSLPVIRMNMKSIKKENSQSILDPYFTTYNLVNRWEDAQFNKEKTEGRAKLIPVPDSCRKELPGSRKLAYIPRVPGIDPKTFDKKGIYGYKPISVIDTEIQLNREAKNSSADDDDEEGGIEVNPAQIDDVVDTEFGFGIVTGFGPVPKKGGPPTTIKVDVKGLGQILTLPKTMVWLVKNPEAADKIQRQMDRTRGNGMARLPLVTLDMPAEPAAAPPKIGTGQKPTLRPVRAPAPPTRPVITPNTNTDIEEVEDDEGAFEVTEEEEDDLDDVVEITDEDEEEDQDVSSPRGGGAGGNRLPLPEEEGRDNEIDIHGEIVDGQIALTCFADDLDSDLLQEKFDFEPITPYYAVKVVNSKALADMLALLQKKFTINPAYIQNFNPYMDLMRAKRLPTFDPSRYRDTMRFFGQSDFPRSKTGEIRPYPIIWRGSLFIAVNRDRTPSIEKFLNVVRNANIVGTKLLPKVQESLLIRFFKDKKLAMATLYKILDHRKVPNHKDTLAFLRTARAVRAPEPEEETPPVRRNLPVAPPRNTQVRVAPPRTSDSRQVTRPPQRNTRRTIDEVVEEVVEDTPNRNGPSRRPSFTTNRRR